MTNPKPLDLEEFQKKIKILKEKLIENLCEKLYSSIPANYATCDLICSNYVNSEEWKNEKKRYDKKYVDSLKVKKCPNCKIIEKILKGD